MLAALHISRVLAPVTALTAPGADADVVLALLDDGAGARALPVFSSLATLARWDPAARPVPVEGPRAAAVAVAEGADDLVLDVAGPVTVTLGGRELRALLRPVAPTPAYADPELAAALRAVLAHEPAVRSAWIGPAAGVDARLSLAVGEGDPAAVARAVAGRLSPLTAASVLGLDLAVVPTGWTAPSGHRSLLGRG